MIVLNLISAEGAGAGGYMLMHEFQLHITNCSQDIHSWILSFGHSSLSSFGARKFPSSHPGVPDLV